jgi:hypothetical protein
MTPERLTALSNSRDRERSRRSISSEPLLPCPPPPADNDFQTRISDFHAISIIPTLKWILIFVLIVLVLLLVGLGILSWKKHLANSLCWYFAFEIGLMVSTSLWAIGCYNTDIQRLPLQSQGDLMISVENWVINKNYLIVTAISIAVNLYGRFLLDK